jgi:MFS-type transporter involved in bile tolerance (Atg22 family)
MPNQQQPNKPVKYAGLGIQLVGICLALVVGGLKLDEYLNLEHVFLLIGIFIAVFAVIYILIAKLK